MFRPGVAKALALGSAFVLIILGGILIATGVTDLGVVSFLGGILLALDPLEV